MEKKQTYSERAADFLKKSEKNHERFLKTLETVQQTRGKAQAVAKLSWALGLDDKPTKS